MTTIYLYCTKAKPWLCINSGTFFGSNNPYELAGAREKLSVHLNGTICFECEIEKAEKIVIAPFPFANGDYQYASKTLTPDALEARSCLSVRELNDYDPRHALYLKNVKAIKPFPITGVARRDPTHLNLAEGIASGMFRAPQNMCWAWAWNDEERKWERVLVLSLRPKNLCNIANGLKDIETRRVVVKEIKEMEK